MSEKTIQNTQFKTNHTSEFKILIPLKTSQELLRILKDDDTLFIYHDSNQILFKTSRFEFISRLVDGNFPDYAAVIPTTFGTEAILKHGDFLNALKVTAVLSSRTNEVRIQILLPKKNLEISSGNQAVGENTYLLTGKIAGDPIDTTLNWRYVLDALKALKTEDVFVGINKENKPALIKSPHDASYFYIVMPILKT